MSIEGVYNVHESIMPMHEPHVPSMCDHAQVSNIKLASLLMRLNENRDNELSTKFYLNMSDSVNIFEIVSEAQ